MLDRVHIRVCLALQWLLGAALLLACQLAGEAAVRALSWPVPGAVVGMLLLWGGLCLVGCVPRGLALVAGALLSHLMLPLIPLVAGVGEHLALLRQYGVAVLLVCAAGVVATTICAAVAYTAAARRSR
ncbi:CidA/LrgA family protein [Paucibacter sediminis]|uniref:CidA/LrgA family protein n=1 Tax=Paucibacter sediminis TaxID=3019553 RepID=A0AA95NK06_9BURK|nr:CidA/LrgA family protein [Paucibacter sp. S2-9]WIT14144.1 CidA/LrgA family protein [Paucibacter sp. S2-9]